MATPHDLDGGENCGLRDFVVVARDPDKLVGINSIEPPKFIPPKCNTSEIPPQGNTKCRGSVGTGIFSSLQTLME